MSEKSAMTINPAASTLGISRSHLSYLARQGVVAVIIGDNGDTLVTQDEANRLAEQIEQDTAELRERFAHHADSRRTLIVELAEEL